MRKCICMLFFFCVKSSISQKLSLGVYESKESHRKIALLDNKRFLVLSPTIDEPVLTSHDTISFGKWGRVGNFLKLDSDVSIVKDTLSMEVKEDSIFSADSVYFEIRSGVYDSLDRQQEEEPILQYRLWMEDENDWHSRSLIVPRICSFHRKNFAGIKGLRLEFYPNTMYFGSGLDYSSFYTNCYSIQATSSNYFILNVPSLTYEYILYKRLLGEYVRVVSDKEMEWKNERFFLESGGM